MLPADGGADDKNTGDDNSQTGDDGDQDEYVPLTKIYLYAVGPFMGNLGGREGADALCQEANEFGDDYQAHAVLSIWNSDEIADMPARFGVPLDRVIVGPTDLTIASSWSDFKDGTIVRSLANADVLSSGDKFMTGSTSSFTKDSTANCDDFTSATDSDWVILGSADNTSSWVSVAAGRCNHNGEGHKFLCLVY